MGIYWILSATFLAGKPVVLFAMPLGVDLGQSADRQTMTSTVAVKDDVKTPVPPVDRAVVDENLTVPASG